MWLFHDLIVIQREIYLAFADRIRDFASTGNWSLLSFPAHGCPLRRFHALTPGHSKVVLATYLTGSTTSVRRGFLSPWSCQSFMSAHRS